MTLIFIRTEDANGMGIEVGSILILDWNTRDSDGNYIEEKCRVVKDTEIQNPDDLVGVDAAKYKIDRTLSREHSTHCCLVEYWKYRHSIYTTFNTKGILIENEWYTKSLLSSHDCIEPQDL